MIDEVCSAFATGHPPRRPITGHRCDECNEGRFQGDDNSTGLFGHPFRDARACLRRNVTTWQAPDKLSPMSHSAAVIYSPGPSPRTVRAADGRVLAVPQGWELLPPGDAALTRRVKAAGEFWAIAEPVGRKIFSRGIWAPAATIASRRAELAVERADPAHARRQTADRLRREKAQAHYVSDFRTEVIRFLDFAPVHAPLAQQLADAVAAHATPVGSGTVARTQRIPVEARAAAAVIAWMRHQTTAYDSLTIPRVKGQRREVRRQLADHSRRLLDRYRRGEPVGPHCPLRRALEVPPKPAPG